MASKSDARPYQLDLLDAAIDENTIVALGTGAGKTFIAVMLIKEYSHEIVGSYIKDDAKRTFFLVPNVPLVKQQAQYIRQQTHLSVGEFIGDMNVDSWEQSRWIEQFESCSVLVMTKQILLNLLRRSFIATKKINLLILDECHHAVKNDSYVEIMNTLQSSPEHQRPRVLGLSASILPSKCKPGQLEKSIRKLEETLHCRAQTAGDLAEVTRYAATPEIKYLDYRLTDSDQQSSLRWAITEPLEFLDKFKKEIKSCRMYKMVKGHFEDCLHILDNLGLWCAHEFAFNAVEELKVAKVKDEGYLWEKALLHLAVTHLRIFERESSTLLAVPGTCRTPVTAKVERLLLELGDNAVVKGMLCDSAICRTASEGGDSTVSEGSEDSPSSSAVNVGDVARRSRPSKLLGIVFVERRTTARLLAEVIKRRSQEDYDLKHIQCDYLVGHSSGTTSGDTYLRKEARMSHKKQNEQLQQFRSEKINLLIATGVVEEGLDVPKCNMVCRFDLPPNFRSYIQSKGRARAKGSVFYLLVDKAHEGEQKKMITDYCLLEEELNALCHERMVPDEEGKERLMEHLAPPYEPFGKGSDVRATLLSSRSMVHKYCQKLPKDRYTTPSPIFICAECQANCSDIHILEGAHHYKYPWHKCYLRLPFNSPISNKIIMGPAMPSKQWAEKAAALQAIRILHEAKELDDSLVPIARRAGEDSDDVVDEGGRGERMNKDAGTQKKSQIYKKETAAILLASGPKAGIDSFLYIFVLQETVAGGSGQYYQSPGSNEGPHPSFGLLTSKPIPHSRLPPFPLYVKERELRVSVHRHCTAVSLSAEEFDLLCRCHDALFTEVLRFCVQSATVGGSTAAEGLKDYLCVPVGFMEPTVAYIDIEMAKIIASLSETRFSPVYWPCPLESLLDDRLLGVCHRDSTMGQGKALELYQVVRVDPHITPASEFPEHRATFASYFKAKYNFDLTDLGQPALVCVPVGTQCLQLTTSRYKAANGRDLEARSHSRGDTERLFFPQQCKMYRLPAHMMHLAMCVPSLLWRLENLLLVEELRAVISSVTKVGINRSGQELTTSTVLHGYRDEGCYTSEVRCHNPTDGTYTDAPPSLSLSGPHSVGPDCGLLLQALTPRGANDIINLERLETLGDAFLKLVSAMSVWGSNNTSNLTKARSSAVGNFNLYTLAINKGLPGKVQSDFRPREAWLPPRFAPPPQSAQGEQDALGSSPWSHQRITDKGVADCVEALAGAYLVAGGLIAGLAFLGWLGFLGPTTSSGEPDALTAATNHDDLFHVLIQHSRSAFHSSFGPLVSISTCSQLCVDSLGTRVPVDDLDALIRRCMGTSGPPRVLGWTFRDHCLFVQALTHSSYARNWITDWYKRLEFLGDAVLDYLVTSHVYATKREFTPGEISAVRSALVNNGSFAEVVVREQVHTHLLHTSPSLFRHLQQYVSAMEQKASERGGEEEDLEPYGELQDCEPEELELDPPKVLGDLLESLMGAIFLDSGMDLEAVWRVFITVFGDKIGIAVQDANHYSCERQRQFTFPSRADKCEDCIPVTPLQQLFEMMPNTQMKIKRTRCTLTIQEKDISETVSARSAQASKQIAARRVIRRLQASETQQ